MNREDQLEELRELFLSAPIPPTTLAVALLTGLALLTIVLWLVRCRALREEYTPIWLLTPILILGFGLWQAPISWLARAIGAWTQTSVLFLLALMSLFLMCLNYAVRLSELNLQVKNLAQELTLLRAEMDQDRHEV